MPWVLASFGMSLLSLSDRGTLILMRGGAAW